MEKTSVYNERIIRTIEAFLKIHPELRFNQALFALGVIEMDENHMIKDKFYEPSYTTYINICKHLESRNQE